MKKFFTFAVSCSLAIGFATSAHAAKFANQFAEFELPPQWQCNLEGAEWVCQTTNDQRKKDAIIVLAAKLKGDQDSIDQYLAYLKSPKTYTSVTGKSVKSEPKYADTKNINGQVWVDSLHMESELPGFFTRYLATVKQDIGVLVTYSINKTKYTEYQQDFENMVKTLTVFRKSGGINAAPANSNLFQNTTIPAGMTEGSVFGNAAPTATAEGETAPKPTKKKDNSLLYIILLVGAGVGFILYKKKQDS